MAYFKINNVDLLVTEGTTLVRSNIKNKTEEELYKECSIAKTEEK